MQDKVIAVLMESMELEEADFGPETDFTQLDEWDSLAQLTLIALLDEHFEVEVPADAFKRIQTVEDLLNEIERRKSH